MLVNEIPLELFEDQAKKEATNSKPKSKIKMKKECAIKANSSPEEHSDDSEILLIRREIPQVSASDEGAEELVDIADTPVNVGDEDSSSEESVQLEEMEEPEQENIVAESSSNSDNQSSDENSDDSPRLRRSARGRIPKLKTDMKTLGGNLDLEPVGVT